MKVRPLTRSTANIAPPPEPRILQFGGGNFLRAFLDWMVELMNQKIAFGAGLLVVKPTSGGSYEDWQQQDGLFFVGERGLKDGHIQESFLLISCIAGILSPYEDFPAFLQSAAIPGIELVVSNTTEAGIVYNPEDRFDDRPAGSFPGKLAQWLYQRYQHFEGEATRGVTVLPCELIEDNGRQLKNIVRRLAEKWKLDPGFGHWLEEHNRFCNTLVDRIVPGAPKPEELPAIQAGTGFTDQRLVLAEPYHLWLIEGDEDVEAAFPAREAGLQVRIVNDLTPYRTLKVRILNGAHTAMVPLGLLRGLETVREFIEDEELGDFLRKIITEEIIPSLEHDRQEALSYATTTIERFRNPFIHHRLADIALNSTAKFSSRLLPTFEAYYQRYHHLPRRLTRALAALVRFYGHPWRGRKLPVKDSPEAIAWFKKAWQEKSTEAVARKALSYWQFSKPLAVALEKELGQMLQEWDSTNTEG